MVAYDSVLSDTEQTVDRVFRDLGKGNAQRAAEVVRPDMRTQHPIEDERHDDVDPGTAAIFDELYDVALYNRPITDDLIERLEVVNEELSDRFCDAVMRVRMAG